MNKPQQARKQRERQLKIEEALNYVINDDRGRFFIAEILGEMTLSDTNAYTGNNDTFRNLGQQQVYQGLKSRVIAILGINGLTAWHKMEKEKYERMEEL